MTTLYLLSEDEPPVGPPGGVDDVDLPDDGVDYD